MGNISNNDSYSAAHSRIKDMEQLRKNEDSIVFALYCSGVAVECMLKAFSSEPFDGRHDLLKIFNQSDIGSKLSERKKEELSLHVKKISKFWRNDFRYYSEIRMKRLIANEMVHSKGKNINKYLNKYKNFIFQSSIIIVQIGDIAWKQSKK